MIITALLDVSDVHRTVHDYYSNTGRE